MPWWFGRTKADMGAGPSPWFLRGESAPRVPGFTWRETTERDSWLGRIELAGASSPVAVFGFYNWVLPLPDSRLLVWNQPARRDEEEPAPVTFAVFNPQTSATIEPEEAHELVDSGVPVVFGSEPDLTFSLLTGVVGADLPAHIPLPLDELLLWCRSSGAQHASGVPGGDTALMVLNPGRGLYILHEQEWFNTSATDFGYQWLTRVARDPRTGRVHGEGIRVGSFVLDGTLRNRSR